MNCKNIQSLSFKYHEKLLDDKLHSEVDKHLQECQHCLGLFNSTAKTVAVLDQLKNVNPEVSFFFTEKTLAKISSAQPEQTISQWVVSVLFGKTKIISASIAALFIGVILGFLLNNNYNITNNNYSDTNSQTLEDIYMAETSDDYMIRFFDNQKYQENGNQ